MHAFLVSALLSFAPAPAADAAPATDQDADSAAKVGDNKYIFVEGDDLEGDQLSPGGTPVTGRIGVKHESMISIRGAFLPELTRMALDM